MKNFVSSGIQFFDGIRYSSTGDVCLGLMDNWGACGDDFKNGH